jgi:LemA protein
MKKFLIIAPLLVILAFAAGAKFMRVRDDLVAQRAAVTNGWTLVESALQGRADLMPDLVDTMKQLARIDPAEFKEIAAARASLAAAHSPRDQILANDQLSAALARLLVLSERYPRLRDDESFQRVQDAIEEKENAIAVERRKYNETLEHYNAQIQMFPDNLVAGISGFARNDQYFPTEGAAGASRGK